jgi:NTP pyrophosphatase (non-canonical NTP hydrolase)
MSLDHSAAEQDTAITTDSATTVDSLRQMVRRFVDDRQWRKFHAPKNVAMGIAIEAAELMEHVQWIDEDASRRLASDASKLSDVADELADVLCFCLALANELEIDIATAMRTKMAKNRLKYPAEQCQGQFWPPEEN